jgi:hypothetical protein
MVMKTTMMPRVFQPFDSKDFVRVGKDNDGGYLTIKEDILKTKKLISFGIDTDWSFEIDFMKMNDCSITAYDNSVSQKLLNDKTLQESYLNFFSGNKTHISKNIGDTDTDDLIQFKTVIDNSGDGLFLKCDIEEYEYQFLDDLICRANQFTGVVMEFHNINNSDNFNSLTNFISKFDLKLVHLHCNNWAYFKLPDGSFRPDCLELTFTSSKVIYNSRLILPRELDMPNNPGDSDFQILF